MTTLCANIVVYARHYFSIMCNINTLFIARIVIVIAVVATVLHASDAKLNLFVNKEEVQTLLGMNC